MAGRRMADRLTPIADRVGSLDLVIVSRTTRRRWHTDECRAEGYDFIADPTADGLDGRREIKGVNRATYLFSNDYEDGLISQKTG